MPALTLGWGVQLLYLEVGRRLPVWRQALPAGIDAAPAGMPAFVGEVKHARIRSKCRGRALQQEDRCHALYMMLETWSARCLR